MHFKKILFASVLSLLLNATNTEPQCEPEGPIAYIGIIEQALNSFGVEPNEEKPRLDLLMKVIQLNWEQYNKLDKEKLTRNATYSEYLDPLHTEVVYGKEMNTCHTFPGLNTDPGLEHCIYNSKDGSISIPMDIIFLHKLFSMSDVMRFIAKENTARLLLKTIYSDEGYRYIEDLIKSGLPNRTIFKILDMIRRCNLMIPFETNEQYVEGHRGCITGATKNKMFWEEFERHLISSYRIPSYYSSDAYYLKVDIDPKDTSLLNSANQNSFLRQERDYSFNEFYFDKKVGLQVAFAFGLFSNKDYCRNIDHLEKAASVRYERIENYQQINELSPYLDSLFSFKETFETQKIACSLFLDMSPVLFVGQTQFFSYRSYPPNFLFGPKHAFRYAKAIEPKYKEIGVQTSIENINTEIHTSMTSAVKSRALHLFGIFANYGRNGFMNYWRNTLIRHCLDFYGIL